MKKCLIALLFILCSTSFVFSAEIKVQGIDTTTGQAKLVESSDTVSAGEVDPTVNTSAEIQAIIGSGVYQPSDSDLTDLADGTLSGSAVQVNSSTSAGVVSSGSGQNAQVWKTDINGNPAWRIDATGGAGGYSVYIEEGDLAKLNNSAADMTVDFGNGFDTSVTGAEIDISLDFTEVAGHDNFTDFVVNEHIDWTAATAGTIHIDNYIEDEDLGVDEVYAVGWNTDTNSPEKDDVYDYLHLIDTNDDGDVDTIDATLWATKQAAMGADDNYVTDAEKTVIGNTSNTNTGDQTAIPNSALANMTQKTYKGRTTASTGVPEDVAGATLKTDLGLVKGDVGLGNVDNTTDAGKPVSTATQTALDLKAPLISPSFTTPTLGVATATSINKVAITAPATASTLTIVDGATLTASATASVEGTNTGDQTLPTDATIVTTDVTTNNASISKHGWFPKLPTAANKFLRDDMTWQTPPGGGEAFPVGSVFIAVVSTNPATLLGYGTWSAIGAGRVLVGLDSGDTDFDTVEETGGAKTKTLAESEIPSHVHGELAPSSASSGALKFGIDTNASGSQASGLDTAATGGGTVFSMMNPYIVVYMWKRVSQL